MKFDIYQVEQYCDKHGIRLTERRKQVLSKLLQSEKALSAYELIEDCNKKAKKIFLPCPFIEY